MKYFVIIIGSLWLFYTSSIAATPYISGYFGSNIFKICKLKTTNNRKEKDVRVHYKNHNKRKDLAHCVDFQSLTDAFADLTEDLKNNVLIPQEDIIAFDNIPLDLDVFLSGIIPLPCVGLRGDAPTKLQNFLKKYKEKMVQFFPENKGFIIQGDPILHVSEDGQDISLTKVNLQNQYLPFFQSTLIWGSGKRKEGIAYTQFADNCFEHETDFYESFISTFLNSPDSIERDWYKAVAELSNEPESSVINESDISSTSSSMTQQNTAFTWGGILGIHHTFFGHRSFFGGYAGTELFYEMNCGTIHLKSSDASSNAFLLKGKTYVYDQEMPAINNMIKIKTRNSVGVTVFAGLATRNKWLIYFPVSAKLTCYRMEFCPDIASIVKYDHISAPKGIGIQNKQVFEASHMTMNPNSGTRPANHKIEKNKFGFEYGVGLRTSLTRSVMFGVRWMHSIGSRLNFETPAYASGALHDLDRFGTDTAIHVGSSSFMVELLFNF